MKNIQAVDQNTPAGRAVFALNYYISTGDHVGEGVAYIKEKSTVLLVAHRPREWEDKDNWERLLARIRELENEKFPCVAIHEGGDGEFTFWGIRVLTSELDNFAAKIKEKPGPRGWGSMYTFLERHGLLEAQNDG